MILLVLCVFIGILIKKLSLALFLPPKAKNSANARKSTQKSPQRAKYAPQRHILAYKQAFPAPNRSK